MTVREYNQKVKQLNFNEHPLGFAPGKDSLSDVVDFNTADLHLKLYLAELILCRSFYGTYIAWSNDVYSFIASFFNQYEKDFIRRELSGSIKEAAAMILDYRNRSKGIIATVFMFGIIEFYAKYKLGFRPLNYNLDDPARYDYIKKLKPRFNRNDLTMKPAFKYLQQANLPIATALNRIDKYTTDRLKHEFIPESKQKGIMYTIADRLTLARNPMLHGELHGFSDKGPYLLMIYILFHLYDLKEQLTNQTP